MATDRGNRQREDEPVVLSAAKYQLPTAGELALLRDKADLTKTEVARHIGVNRHTIRRWETGQAAPDLDTLRELLSVYRVEIMSNEQ